MSRIAVVQYDPDWDKEFRKAESFYQNLLQDLKVKVVHVGSTSVEGLWAKPILDIDIIVSDTNIRDRVIRRLTGVGYTHLGDLGISGREVLSCPLDNPHVTWMAHHLYICLEECTALRNHLLLKNHLCMDREAVREYSRLKRQLAEQHPNDIDAYVEGKTALITSFLAAEGMAEEEILDIGRVNSAIRLNQCF